MTFEDTASYAYIIDYSKKGSRSRHNITGKNYELGKVTYFKMSDIVENKQLKFLIVPNQAEVFDREKESKFSNAVEYLVVDLPNVEDKFKTIREEKKPMDLKLRVGVSVDALGLLKINVVELEYEYIKMNERHKTISVEEFERDKEEKK